MESTEVEKDDDGTVRVRISLADFPAEDSANARALYEDLMANLNLRRNRNGKYKDDVVQLGWIVWSTVWDLHLKRVLRSAFKLHQVVKDKDREIEDLKNEVKELRER